MRRPRPLTGALLAALTVAAAVTGFAGAGRVRGRAEHAVRQPRLRHVQRHRPRHPGPAVLHDPGRRERGAAGADRADRADGDHPYTEAVTLTHSGTASAPITFTGAPGDGRSGTCPASPSSRSLRDAVTT